MKTGLIIGAVLLLALLGLLVVYGMSSSLTRPQTEAEKNFEQVQTTGQVHEPIVYPSGLPSTWRLS